MKNKIILFVIFVFIYLCPIFNFKTVFAADDIYKISSASTAVERLDSNRYLVPIYMTNNKGIMGFRINISVDANKVDIESIKNGKITEDGNFGYNFMSEDKRDSVSILWNHSENIVMDGSLFYIVVSTQEDIDTVKFQIDYSQEDTFDEKWKDVVLSVGEINLNLKDDTKDSKNIPKELVEIINNDKEKERIKEIFMEDKEKGIIENIGYDVVKNSVLYVLNKKKYKSLSDITSEEETMFMEDLKEFINNHYKVKKKKLNKLEFPEITEKISFTNEELQTIDLKNMPVKQEDKILFLNKYVLISIICVFVLIVIVIIIKRRRGKIERNIT